MRCCWRCCVWPATGRLGRAHRPAGDAWARWSGSPKNPCACAGRPGGVPLRRRHGPWRSSANTRSSGERAVRPTASASTFSRLSTAAGRSRQAEVPGGLPAEFADIPQDEPEDVGRRSMFWGRGSSQRRRGARTNSSSSCLPGVSAVPSCRSRTLAVAGIRPANPAPRCRAGRWPTNSASVTTPCGSGPPGRPGAWPAPSRTRLLRSSVR